MEPISLPQGYGRYGYMGEEMKLTNYWWWRGCRSKVGTGGYFKDFEHFLFCQRDPEAPQITQARSKMRAPLPPVRYLCRSGEQPHKSQRDRLSSCPVTMRWQSQRVTQICLLILEPPKLQSDFLKRRRAGGFYRGQPYEDSGGPQLALALYTATQQYYSILFTGRILRELEGLWRFSPFLRVCIDTEPVNRNASDQDIYPQPQLPRDSTNTPANSLVRHASNHRTGSSSAITLNESSFQFTDEGIVPREEKFCTIRIRKRQSWELE